MKNSPLLPSTKKLSGLTKEVSRPLRCNLPSPANGEGGHILLFHGANTDLIVLCSIPITPLPGSQGKSPPPPPLEPFEHCEHGKNADTSYKNLLPEGTTVTHLTPTLGTKVKRKSAQRLGQRRHGRACSVRGGAQGCRLPWSRFRQLCPSRKL
ncbi:uncharacterized protein B0T23DRAFT_205326 [Neurospora hispaniola]|uniref:Uncharacterized protein n=1 Tax=Neurospora hispaniola TaxID=588809 RepID=A0AAJ0I147_9PEZI|nr:hypothetical protein B0T23DRAFT_205326 [Neurospora hispaniola]